MQGKKRMQMFKLQLILEWRQLKRKKEYIIGKFTNEEIEQYVSKLYMHDTIMPITLSIETPYKACVSIEVVNQGVKKMSNGKS